MPILRARRALDRCFRGSGLRKPLFRQVSCLDRALRDYNRHSARRHHSVPRPSGSRPDAPRAQSGSLMLTVLTAAGHSIHCRVACQCRLRVSSCLRPLKRRATRQDVAPHVSTATVREPALRYHHIGRVAHARRTDRGRALKVLSGLPPPKRCGTQPLKRRTTRLDRALSNHRICFVFYRRPLNSCMVPPPPPNIAVKPFLREYSWKVESRSSRGGRHCGTSHSPSSTKLRGITCCHPIR